MLTTILCGLSLAASPAPDLASQEPKVVKLPAHYVLSSSDGPLKARSDPVRIPIDADREDDQGRELGSFEIDGNELAVAVEATSSKKPIKITIGGKAAKTVEATPQHGRRGTTWVAADAIAIAGHDARVIATKGRDGSFTVMLLGGYLVGSADLDGSKVHFAVINSDDDAALGSKGDFWTVLDERTLAAFNDRRGGSGYSFSRYSMIEAGEPCFVGKREVRLRGVAADDTLEVAIGPATETFDEYLHRRAKRVFAEWNERFEGPLKGLIGKRGEPGRPKAARPIDWIHAIDLDAALTRAKAEHKPILADFETDWCIWCKVLDKLTYPDAEVAAFVTEHFVPVKLNVELMPNTLAKEYEITGFPGLAVIDPSGKKIDHISGFSPPSKILPLLKAAHAKFAGGKHGG